MAKTFVKRTPNRSNNFNVTFEGLTGDELEALRSAVESYREQSEVARYVSAYLEGGVLIYEKDERNAKAKANRG